MLSRKLDEVLAAVEGFTEKAGLGVAVDMTEKDGKALVKGAGVPLDDSAKPSSTVSLR